MSIISFIAQATSLFHFVYATHLNQALPSYAHVAHAICTSANNMYACRLQYLFMQTPGVPFPIPLLVHPPHYGSHPWGSSIYPPGSVVNHGTCHFMQPNSLEFKPAQEWRAHDLIVAELKEAMNQAHQDELANIIQAYIDVGRLALHCHMLNRLYM